MLTPRLTPYEKAVADSLGHCAVYVTGPELSMPLIYGNRSLTRCRVGFTTAPDNSLVNVARAHFLGFEPWVDLWWTFGTEHARRLLGKLRVALTEESDGLVGGWLDVERRRVNHELGFCALAAGVDVFDDEQRLAMIREAVALRSRTRSPAVARAQQRRRG